MDSLREAERLVIDSEEGRLVLEHGRVVLDADDTNHPALESLGPAGADAPDLAVPPSRAEADELMLVSRWIQQARQMRCHDATGVAASRLPGIVAYAPLPED